jgi:hypothetical protein
MIKIACDIWAALEGHAVKATERIVHDCNAARLAHFQPIFTHFVDDVVRNFNTCSYELNRILFDDVLNSKLN